MATRQRKPQPEPNPSAGKKAVDAIHRVEKKFERALTCMWDDLQQWQRDNHFILSGYRPATESFMKCFRSLFYFHNESINIYTHLLGAALFLALLPQIPQLLHRYPTATSSDITASSVFLLSAVTCLGLSATYHTISNHSHRIAKFGNQLDYLGIIILIVGSYLPTVHYGFHQCHPSLGRGYSIMMLLLGAACTAVTLMSRFRTPAYRPFRAGMFVLLGVSGVIPVVHGMQLYGGFMALDARIGLRWVLTEGAMYILGAGIYAARVPERWAPGRFDLVGASHQVFHCFVVAAAVAHLKGLVVAFDFLHGMDVGKC